MAGVIKCIFYSEFHHILGPIISHQVPDDLPLLKDAFDAVHDLIITKPALYDRLVSVDALGYRIVGSPRSIENKKYQRNAFIFNFVFVFEVNTDTALFEPVILKLGAAFKTYELESSFLSQEESQSKLQFILCSVFNDFNRCGCCTIPIDETKSLHLKITPSLPDPPTIQDHHVPIFTCSQEDIDSAPWDLTIQQILPYVNGFNHVKKIAEESEVDNEIVKVCVQHLILYAFVKLITIFQYSNVYIAEPKIKLLLDDAVLQKECIEYVALQGAVPKIGAVFRLYCSLEAGLTVKDLCIRVDMKSEGVNERTFIQYGLMRGLIRHLQKYPVSLRSDYSLPSPLETIKSYLDGSHCYDELCCKLGISGQELDKSIEDIQSIIVCWK
ncbi:hypothetical protein EMCRGX_G001221 [Ephydatia muelleri]